MQYLAIHLSISSFHQSLSLQMESTTTSTCNVGVAKVKKVSLSCLQAMLLNLYNVRTKLRCTTTPFKSQCELPLPTTVDVQTVQKSVDDRLNEIFDDGDDFG